MKRPQFLGIVSSATLATHLARKSTGSVEGFIVEGSTAGGHNAPPRGMSRLNAKGEPLYGEKDLPDLEAIKKIGLPFWLAGAFGTPEKLREALSLGAAGVQVGTAFAYCDESGLPEKDRRAVIDKWFPSSQSGTIASQDRIFTDPLASPTGFPFKVIPLKGTLSEKNIYELRPRKCDLGYLRQIVAAQDGTLTYRCAAEPVADYVAKGGKVDDTANRKCLCNALMANVGLGNDEELPLFTAGDDLVRLGRYLSATKRSYSAAEVIQYVLGEEGSEPGLLTAP